jgi:hypothetical protein
MKRKLLLSLSLMTGMISYGQITINANDVIGYGEFIEQTVDTIPSIAHGPAGADQTWNYAGLLNAHTTSFFGFGAPGWYSGSSEFPDATLAINDAASGVTSFFRKNSDALDLLGIYGDFVGSGNEEALVFDPFERLISFPSTYQTEFFNSYSFDFSFDGSAFSVDSIVVQSDTDKSSEMDAWGTITTPLGTFDVIRQYIYEVTTTVIDAYLFGISVFNDTQVDETHTYSFWTNDPDSRFVVLEYTYDPGLDMVLEVTWQSASPVLSLEEEGMPVSKLNVFPNPASDMVTLDVTIDGAHSFEVVDALGRIALSGEFNGNTHALSVAALENGLYSIRLMNVNSGQVNVQRIVVQH